MANEVWAEIYDRLATLVREHRTTLVFVNTRRLAERAARHLAERLGRSGHRAPRQPRPGTPAGRRAAPEGRPSCGRWWPPPRWNSASTSARSTCLPDRQRRAPSPPSCSAWAARATASRRAEGPAVSADARRPGGMRGAARCRAPRRAGSHPAARPRARRAGAADRRRGGLPRVAGGRAVRAGAPRLALPRSCRARTFDRWCRCWPMATPPGAAARAYLHRDAVNGRLRAAPGAAHRHHQRRRDSRPVRLRRGAAAGGHRSRSAR
jgi:hypothetical protein